MGTLVRRPEIWALKAIKTIVVFNGSNFGGIDGIYVAEAIHHGSDVHSLGAILSLLLDRDPLHEITSCKTIGKGMKNGGGLRREKTVLCVKRSVKVRYFSLRLLLIAMRCNRK